jgi:hypothetical protein
MIKIQWTFSLTQFLEFDLQIHDAHSTEFQRDYRTVCIGEKSKGKTHHIARFLQYPHLKVVMSKRFLLRKHGSVMTKPLISKMSEETRSKSFFSAVLSHKDCISKVKYL